MILFLKMHSGPVSLKLLTVAELGHKSSGLLKYMFGSRDKRCLIFHQNVWHFKESPGSKLSLWRNGRAALTLMLNQHLVAFLSTALAHVSNAGEPGG